MTEKKTDKKTEKDTLGRGFAGLKPIHKAASIALVAAAALIAICLVTEGMGIVGGGIRTVLRGLLSWGSVVIPIALIAQAVGFAEDLKSRGFVKRTVFAAVATVLVSCIEYAISAWGSVPEFYPVEAFVNMADGGFAGNLIGFLLSKAFNPIGAIIICVMALAIYTVFFFAERAGSVGQAAINFANGIKAAVGFVRDKHAARVEKKRQLKEDADQHQRELASQELADDEFFRAKGEADAVKIKGLGIEENADTHGLSPLVDPEKRIPKEPDPIPEEPVIRHRRADKPIDLSYGIEEEPEVEAVDEPEPEAPRADRFAMGLDDSADNVFTRDFDPFDFATGEKQAAKYASKVAVGSPVTEELDDMTVYRMKADHEPDEREKRLMELERRKQEWERRKQKAQPSAAPIHSEPSPAPTVTAEPVAPAPTYSAPATPSRVATPTYSTPVAAPISTRTTPAPTHQPKTVEFTISKTPSAETHPPVESKPVTVTVDKAARAEASDEDIAILISERVAAANPGYARSANDLKTYTTVVADGDEELYRQLSGISTPEPAAPVTEATVAPMAESPVTDPHVATHTAEAPVTDLPVDTHTAEAPVTDVPVATHSAEAPVTDVPVATHSAEAPVTDVPVATHSAEAPVIDVPVATHTEEAPVTAPAVESSKTAPIVETPVTASSIEPTYEAETIAAGTVATPVVAPAIAPAVDTPAVTPADVTVAPAVTTAVASEPAAPEFKPYSAPTESIQTPAASEGATLKAERSMLPPTPEAITEPVAPAVSTPPSTTPTQNTPEEIDFTPADEEIHPVEAVAHSDGSLKAEAEPLFDAIDTAENEEDDAVEDEGVEVSFDDDFEDEDDGDGDDMPEEEPETEADAQEIPPEEQNPEVIRMREMFNCLDPVESTPKASIPAADRSAEITVPAEETPPFDGGVRVDNATASPLAEATAVTEPAPPADTISMAAPVITNEAAAPTAAPSPATPTAALVPVDEKKSKKKDKPDYSDYEFPPIDLLAKEEDSHDDNIQAEIQENADKLIETLASFGVTASIKGVDRGPRITRYEVVPAKGVKVSSILGLQDDIALNLAAGSIRMEAPIPGKSAVGIEIPNKSSSIVRLRDLIETPDFQSARSKTFVCIGRDVAGQPVFGDLAKMPHLLIAGATGMGKSVCINSLLISILYKARPDEVKFIMIDPKQVEFTMYNGIPHLLIPVVSDPKQAAGALMWAVEEMERRYNLLNSVCSKSVESYNEKVAKDPSLGEHLPTIIIVIDEFADLMLQVKDPVEQLVTRIAQKARAAGIHLVIGTQRPSVNVITGVIKANVPSRISCKVMSNVDSKTVLDSAGAEKLLDKGDALYAPAGSPKPHRVQCAFVHELEAENIMNALKEKSDGAVYDSAIMEDIERATQRCSKKGGADRDDSDGADAGGEGYLNDRQFLDAVEIAVNTRKISTSLIQRKLSIGYGKAAKFIDIMEDMGIVGEANGQRPREVLLSPDDWREKLARSTID